MIACTNFNEAFVEESLIKKVHRNNINLNFTTTLYDKPVVSDSHPHAGDIPPAVPHSGYTALMVAARSDNAKAIKALITAGADIDKKSGNDKTAVFIAAEYSAPHAVGALLHFKADVTLRAHGVSIITVCKEPHCYKMIERRLCDPHCENHDPVYGQKVFDAPMEKQSIVGVADTAANAALG